ESGTQQLPQPRRGDAAGDLALSLPHLPHHVAHAAGRRFQPLGAHEDMGTGPVVALQTRRPFPAHDRKIFQLPQAALSPLAHAGRGQLPHLAAPARGNRQPDRSGQPPAWPASHGTPLIPCKGRTMSTHHLPIVPREKLDFGRGGDIPKYWFGTGPFKTRFLAAMSTRPEERREG